MKIIGGSFGKASAHFNAKGALFIESGRQFKVEAEDIDKTSIVKMPEVKEFRLIRGIVVLIVELVFQTLASLAPIFVFITLLKFFPLNVALGLFLF